MKSRLAKTISTASDHPATSDPARTLYAAMSAPAASSRSAANFALLLKQMMLWPGDVALDSQVPGDSCALTYLGSDLTFVL